MKKTDLLNNIAEKGYDVGFGAKKHFATYDIIEKTPGIISFFTMGFGIFSLTFTSSPPKLISAVFIILGIMGLYIRIYEFKKSLYEDSGKSLTYLYNDLKELYFEVENTDDYTDLSRQQERLKEIEKSFYEKCITKQVLFSNWYAHYKFFWEHQVDWINEQLKLSFFRDKVPLSLWFVVCLISAGFVLFFSDALTVVCYTLAE